MTPKTLSREDLVKDLELTLSEYGYSLEAFAELQSDDIEDWDIQALWFMFHDVVVAWMNERKPVAA